MVKKLLLVGNEDEITKLFSFLITQNFICFKSCTKQGTLSSIDNEAIDLVLLLDSSPIFKYKSIFEEIKRVSSVPIITILNTTKNTDLIDALRDGADACIIEPINNDELLARIEAIMRRSKKFTHSIIRYNGLVWREEAFDLKYLGHPISVSPKEFNILGYLLNHPDKVITYKQLVTALWGKKAEISPRTIHSYMRNIRDKLKEASFPVDLYLITVFGVGYRWDLQHSKEKEKNGGANVVL